MKDSEVRIGISSCLLGEKVRWDGGHKRNAWMTDILGPFVSWIPVCPEAETGMGIPRETVHLVGQKNPRMPRTRSGRDWTGPMHAYAEKKVRGWKSRICADSFSRRARRAAN